MLSCSSLTFPTRCPLHPGRDPWNPERRPRGWALCAKCQPTGDLWLWRQCRAPEPNCQGAQRRAARFKPQKVHEILLPIFLVFSGLDGQRRLGHSHDRIWDRNRHVCDSRIMFNFGRLRMLKHIHGIGVWLAGLGWTEAPKQEAKSIAWVVCRSELLRRWHGTQSSNCCEETAPWQQNKAFLSSYFCGGAAKV